MFLLPASIVEAQPDVGNLPVPDLEDEFDLIVTIVSIPVLSLPGFRGQINIRLSFFEVPA